MAIKKGNKIIVEYTGSLETGEIFDSSEQHGPLEFEVGSGQMIAGFDAAVLGMELNEEKEIDLPPGEAYGEHRNDLLKKIPRKDLPSEPQPQAGLILTLQLPDGQQFPALITEVTDDGVVIDLNHPLAGKTLRFKIKVVAIV